MTLEIRKEWEIFLFKRDEDGLEYALDNYKFPATLDIHFDTLYNDWNIAHRKLKNYINEIATKIKWDSLDV